MPDLIQTVMNALPAGASSVLAGVTGESPAAATSGMAAAIPALLAGAFQKSSTASGANDLLGLVRQATAGGNPLDGLGSILSGETARSSYLAEGQNLASSLLGGKSDSVARVIASTKNISGTAASTILAFVTPLVLGALGRATGPTATATGLRASLANEQSGILKALPAGLGSLFGMGKAAAGAAEGGANRMLPWIVGAAVVALLAFFGLRYFSTPQLPSSRVVVLSLPGGSTVNVAQDSIGFGVAKFLASSEPAPRTFVFDHLNFATASNTLTPESQPTVAALVTILKAYPNARSRVVGYTDNQGDPGSNVQLSASRAETVKAELVKDGIDSGSVTTAGMGEAKPVADNGTEEGRAKNRRTELEIVSK
jgi:hypothetical protein